MAKTEIPRTNFDDIATETVAISKTPPLWGSARLTYTICAFLSMVVQLCLRNTLNFVILCMVKPHQVENSTEYNNSVIAEDNTCGALDGGGNKTTIERVSPTLERSDLHAIYFWQDLPTVVDSLE